MSKKRYTEEYKTEAAKQIIDPRYVLQMLLPTKDSVFMICFNEQSRATY
jgi:hypothetical protein